MKSALIIYIHENDQWLKNVTPNIQPTRTATIIHEEKPSLKTKSE